MLDPETRARSHRNLIEFSALATKLADGGEVVDRGDEMLFRNPSAFPFLSGAIRGHSRDDGLGFVERARGWFAERDQGWVLLARASGEDGSLEAGAETLGMVKLLDRYPAMGCEQRLEAAPVPGLHISQVGHERDAHAYWNVCARSYPAIGFPSDAFSGFGPGLLLRDDGAAFVGRLEGEPVAAAMTVVLDAVGMIAWVATAEGARGRGIGAAISAAATNAAFDLGADLVSLQASPMGEPVYRRMGYRELFNYHLWTQPFA